MSYKRILTIQDISCVGQCSLTVALPILSVCGLETAILPSAVLSTHTAGFSGFTFRDLTEDMPAIAAHWKAENIRFDAIYTGYLGSTKQIEYVKRIINTLGKADRISIVDPAMADNGKLYPAFDIAFVEEMKSLCFSADYILPNLTEACLLTDIPYPDQYDEVFITALLKEMQKRGADKIILTGIGYSDKTTGVVVYEKGQMKYYKHQKIAQGCHGTGDVFAAAFSGALLQGHSDYSSAKIAADFTVRCIEETIGDPEHWYGVEFEKALPSLIHSLDEKNELL